MLHATSFAFFIVKLKNSGHLCMTITLWPTAFNAVALARRYKERHKQ